MNCLPKILTLRENAGRGVFGSFIDPEWVLHYIAAGTWTFQLEERVYRVSAGDMVLLPPRLLHIVYPEGKGKLLQYVIHFALPESIESKFPYALTLSPDGCRSIEALFFSLKTEWSSGLDFRDTVASGFLTAMLGIYLRHASQESKGESVAPVAWTNVERSIQFIHQNYRKKSLSLSQISAASRLSLNYFCRVFSKNTGDSAMNYLSEFRIQKAEELLLRSELNCSQIADEVGFGGIHIFSRTFKKLRGISPTEFKRLHAPRLST